MQAVNDNMEGVASDPIVFQVTLNVSAKASSTEPFSLPVNEEAVAAATSERVILAHEKLDRPLVREGIRSSAGDVEITPASAQKLVTQASSLWG